MLFLFCIAAAPKQPPPPDPLIVAASNAVASGQLKAYQHQVELELEPMLAQFDKADAARLTHLAALREFAKYFDRLHDPDAEHIKTLQWLLTEPKMLDTLMMAVDETDAPDRVLNILVALNKDQPEKLKDYPDLAAAMCVVWDIPAKQKNEDDMPDVQRPVRLMRYFINAGSNFRFDLQQLPYQMATYVADVHVSEDEMEWALHRYAGRGQIGGVYFDVPYDYGTYYGTGDPKQKDRPYTLQNLASFGGICVDQAYFATQVARSLGVPAVTSTGVAGNGEVGHAWVGFLEKQGDHVAWNFTQGRYAEDQFWRGNCIDPQNRQQITEAEVTMLGELCGTPAKNRLESVAITKIADMFDAAHQVPVLMAAINLSPGNEKPWLDLAELAAKMKLDDKQAADLKSAVQKFALRQYPDFAYTVLMHSVAGRGNLQRDRMLVEMQPLFDRPDLAANILLSRGDIAFSEKRHDDALADYQQVLDHYASAGPIIVAAMQHVDRMMHKTGNVAALADYYKSAWQRMPQPETSALIRTTPFYLIGQRYIEVLRELSDNDAAANVQQRLDALDGAAVSRAPMR